MIGDHLVYDSAGTGVLAFKVRDPICAVPWGRSPSRSLFNLPLDEVYDARWFNTIFVAKDA